MEKYSGRADMSNQNTSEGRREMRHFCDDETSPYCQPVSQWKCTQTKRLSGAHRGSLAHWRAVPQVTVMLAWPLSADQTCDEPLESQMCFHLETNFPSTSSLSQTSRYKCANSWEAHWRVYSLCSTVTEQTEVSANSLLLPPTPISC